MEGAVSAPWTGFCFPFVSSQAIFEKESLPPPLWGRMLILVLGLSLAFRPCPPLFHPVPGTQVVLGRSWMKGGKGPEAGQGFHGNHVILLSAGNLLFLVNMSAGSDSHCCAVEALRERATHPAATWITTVLTITLIISS